MCIGWIATLGSVPFFYGGRGMEEGGGAHVRDRGIIVHDQANAFRVPGLHDIPLRRVAMVPQLRLKQ